MKREVETKFYTFNQNNSGGYFIENEKFGIGHIIIIEALNSDHANLRLENIGNNVSGFYDFCACCGDRWYNVDEEDGTVTPEYYGENINNVKIGLYSKYAYIHYIDNSFEKIEFKN